jgi:hypothetical protein
MGIVSEKKFKWACSAPIQAAPGPALAEFPTPSKQIHQRDASSAPLRIHLRPRRGDRAPAAGDTLCRGSHATPPSSPE